MRYYGKTDQPSIKVEIDIPLGKIAGLICSGIEGDMTSQWARFAGKERPAKFTATLNQWLASRHGSSSDDSRTYLCDYPVNEGGAFYLVDTEADRKCCPYERHVTQGYAWELDDEHGIVCSKCGKPAPKLRMDLDAVKRGIQIMQEKYPAHFANFIDENDDSITGDVFIQCCLFGEIVYG